MVRYVSGTTPEQRKQIVEEFCSICDRYAGPCEFAKEIIGLYGFKRESDQERYAMRNFCGWARVKGEPAVIMNDVVEFKDGRIVKRIELSDKLGEQ